jgi:hypothetical protein
VQLTAGPDDPCLPGLSRGEAVARARARAGELGIERGARLLTDRDWTSADDLIDALFVPLVVAGSLVIVRNAAEDVLARRAEQERATVRLR